MKPLDPRLLRHAAATRWFIAAQVVIGVINALLLVWQAFVISDVVVASLQQGQDLPAVTFRLLLLSGITLARAGLSWAAAEAAHRAGAAAVSTLRRDTFARLLELGPAYLNTRRTGELVALATRGATALQEYFGGYLPQLVLAVVVPIVLGLVVLTQDTLSTLLVAITVPLIPLFMILIGSFTQSRVDKAWMSLGVLSGHFLDVVSGLPTLKLFGRARAQQETLRAVGEQYRAATLSVLRISFLSALVLEVLTSLSVAAVAVGIGLRLVDGTLDLRTGLAILIMVPEIYLPLRQVGAQFHAAAEGVAAAEELLEIIELPPAARGTLPVPDLAGAGLSCAGLTVRYPDRLPVSIPAFQVPAGRITAVVGPSGGGKSTLLGVLMGLVGPPSAQISGDIRVLTPDGEVPVADLDPRQWRARLGWVPQVPALLPGTVGENVRFAAAATDAEVTAALRAAGLVSDDLSAGLATPVGEQGRGVSVGQARRIGLARALLRHPQILLCDEPTAALDAGSEAAFLVTLELLREQGRTVLVVTHRPAVVAMADNVVTVPGQIVAAGELVGAGR
ncbi:MAG: thiol reductant ABC exporter subunit CydD [Candidatus Nanopelagicales bacterium]